MDFPPNVAATGGCYSSRAWPGENSRDHENGVVDTEYMVPNEGDWKKLGELQVLIWRIINRQPQYKALPPGRGNYL
jgi:hypothetical protein